MEGINPMIALLIALIIGIVVVLPIAVDLSSVATTIQTVENAEVTGTNWTTDTLTTYGYSVSGLTCYNETGGTIEITSGNYTLTSGRPSTITWIDLNNTRYPSPQYCNYTGVDASYQTSPTSRTITGILPLMIGLAVLLFVVAWGGFSKA